MTNATNTDNLSATLTLTNGRWPVAGEIVKLRSYELLMVGEVGYCDGKSLAVVGHLVEPDLYEDDEILEGVEGKLD